MSVCLSVYLPVYLLLCLYVPVCLCLCLSVCMYLSVFLSLLPFLCNLLLVLRLSSTPSDCSRYFHNLLIVDGNGFPSANPCEQLACPLLRCGILQPSVCSRCIHCTAGRS